MSMGGKYRKPKSQNFTSPMSPVFHDIASDFKVFYTPKPPLLPWILPAV